MIILHALYSHHDPKNILLFGESPLSLRQDQGRREADGTLVFPVGTDLQELWEILVPLTNETIKFHDDIILNHPFYRMVATGSSEYRSILNLPPVTPDSMVECRTPVLSTGIGFFLSLLATRPDKHSCLQYGGTIRFYKKVTELALEMVVRGRYIPSTGRYQNGGICTRWKIHPSSFDKVRIRDLAHAMPPVTYHYNQVNSGESHLISRTGMVILFIETMIMEIVARSVRENPSHAESSLSPIEQMKYAEILTAIFFLQGLDRHKMPIRYPQITNGLRDRFDRWAVLPDDPGLDDLPWTLTAMVQFIGKNFDDTLEPENASGWALKIYIISSDKPEQRIPSEQWENEEKLPYYVLPTREELEQAMGHAFGIVRRCSPNLTVIKRSSINIFFLIPDDDLIRFITYDLSGIENAGLPVIRPDWWKDSVQPFRLGLAIRQAGDQHSSSNVGLHTLLSFNYRVSVGDELIDPEEFRRMVEHRTQFVRVGKRWIRIESDRLLNLIADIDRKYNNKRLSIADFLRLYAKGSNTGTELAIHADDSWTSNLISFITEGRHQIPVSPPSSFCGELRQYQKTGLSFLITSRIIGFGACLADDMGLGKTPQTIAYLLAIKDKDFLDIPALIICPTSIIGNWERELSRFSPTLSVYIHHGSDRKKGEKFIPWCNNYDLVITSYSILYRDREILSDFKWSVVIYDEVQNIKNSRTKQFQAARTLIAGHQIALTGTPVENHLHELWAIMEILNPRFLGTLASFQKYYANPIEKNGDTGKVTELRRLIRPFLLRRTKQDQAVINDLPEKMEQKVYCLLTHEQAALYQATLDALSFDLKSLQGKARRGKILTALTRLKQICNHPSLAAKTVSCESERSGKVKRLIEMLEEVKEENDAAIIFTQYASFARVLVRELRNKLQREVLILTGSTNREKREEIINRFMHPEGPLFFVISLRAGGIGLNLTRAHHVFHFDRWWNPAIEDQATDRAYRIGQNRNVQVHLMIVSGTLEEEIDEMIQKKRSVADQIISSGEEWLTELPTGELLEILRLRETVFGDDVE